MKDKQILNADWDRILDLSVGIANASAGEDEALAEEKQTAPHNVIDELLAKYGEKASLLSVKASYLEDDRKSIDLLAKVYALAEKDNDTYTMAEIAWDLASKYWYDLDDRKNAKLWNDRLGDCLNERNDEIWQEFYQKMLRKLE